jgi:hypothetical protein
MASAGLDARPSSEKRNENRLLLWNGGQLARFGTLLALSMVRFAKGSKFDRLPQAAAKEKSHAFK